MNWPLVVLLLRLVQAGMAFLILILTAYVANWYNVDTLTSSPPQVNFLIYASAHAVLSILYLEGSYRLMPRFFSPVAAIVVHSVYGLFYFGGMIAMAVFLRNLLFCRGNVCMAAQAATAMAGIEVLLFILTSVVLGLFYKTLMRTPARAAGARAGRAGPYPTAADIKAREKEAAMAEA